MKKIIKFLFFVILIILFWWLFISSDDVGQYNIGSLQRDVLLDNLSADVIIIFNSGGWGNTPLKEAEDFASIVEKTQNILKEWGYSSVVVPYKRTGGTFLGKAMGAKDFLNSFKFSSEDLAQEIRELNNDLPDSKIIIAGLSTGAGLANETIKKLKKTSGESKIYAIEAGTPFWLKFEKSDSILYLDNNRKDSFTEGELKSLIFSLVKTPFEWISAKINKEDLAFSQGFQAPGHKYFWDSPEVGPQIMNFLKNKF